MGAVYAETLRLQLAARAILKANPKDAGAAGAWAAERVRVAAIPPVDEADGLAAVHSLLQFAEALLENRSCPETVAVLGAGLRTGLEALAVAFEAAAGTTREQAGLFADYIPPGGLH
jgi:hypothetical protein